MSCARKKVIVIVIIVIVIVIGARSSKGWLLCIFLRGGPDAGG